MFKDQKGVWGEFFSHFQHNYFVEFSLLNILL